MDLPKFYQPKYFKAYEWLPPAEYAQFGERGLFYFIDVRILITADQIRKFFGVPFTINNWYWKIGIPEATEFRGYRPERFYKQNNLNSILSGSQHRFGRAGDGDLKGITATEARDVIMNHQASFPFIRRLEDNVRWLHFDVANTHHNGIHLFSKEREEQDVKKN
jgi:hypothetical protein